MKYIWQLAVLWSTLVVHIHAELVDNNAALIATLEHQLSDPEFAKRTLPNDFSALIFLIECGKETNYPLNYTNSLFKTFTTLLKGSDYVNPQAFIQFLTSVTPLLQRYFIPYKSSKFLKSNTDPLELSALNRLQENFIIILHDTFISNYVSFKQDPDTFLNELAMNAFLLAEEEIAIQTFRKNFIKFIDLAISKLAWKKTDTPQAWDVTKTIALQLIDLVNINAIDERTDLNDLYWSLIHRFCHFVDIQNGELPLNFYEAIKKEINSYDLLLIDLPEDDTFLENKRSYLLRTLMTFEARLRAKNLN
jgi:hypothetical protein